MNETVNTTQENLIINQISESVSNGISDILQKSTEKEFTITHSAIKPFKPDDLKQLFSENFVIVISHITGDIECDQIFVLSPTNTAYLSDLMMMGDGNASYDSKIHIDSIKEFFNQVFGSVITQVQSETDASISNDEFSTEEVSLSADIWVKHAWSLFTLNVKDPANEDIKTILHLIGPNAKAFEQKEVEMIEPEIKTSSENKYPEKDLGILLDISLPIVIELGRTEMLMGDILELGPSSVIELDKLSGDYVDIYVNNKKFAKGEVVVVDENFGVRIMELLSKQDRIKQMK